MNGADKVFQLRRAGFKPAYVWLQDSGLAPTDMAITLSNTDIPEALDLRCLVGVTVLAESKNRERLGRMLRACMGAKAKRVIANLHQQTGEYCFEVIETTDTDGVATWQK